MCHFITPHLHPPHCGWGSIIWYDWVLITIYCVVKVRERLSFVGKQIPCHRFTESATVGCWHYIHLPLYFPIPLVSLSSPLKIAVVRALCCFWHSSDKTANWIILADSKSCQGLFEFWLEKRIYGGYWQVCVVWHHKSEQQRLQTRCFGQMSILIMI